MPAASAVEGGAALLRALESPPARPQRVIVTLKPGPVAREQVLALLKADGAGPVQPIEGRAMLVVDLGAAQLRRLLASGQVLRVQADVATPSN